MAASAKKKAKAAAAALVAKGEISISWRHGEKQQHRWRKSASVTGSGSESMAWHRKAAAEENLAA
jgi:hypothetical protein